jgi:thiamine kinase-like enzyme
MATMDARPSCAADPSTPIESMVHLQGCLPAELRGPTTTISRLTAGLSGAGVYRVEAAGRAFVLKIKDESEPVAGWRQQRQLQQLAANVGAAPRVIHVDETRRAVVSDFVVDRSFIAAYVDPRTRDSALTQLGLTLRRVHDLPLPADANGENQREFLAEIWSSLDGNSAVPAFVRDAVRRVQAEKVPACDKPAVLSHNDVNPGNLLYDGEKVLLVDWEAASRNDGYYDLATIALFLRMNQEACHRMLAAYHGEPLSEFPARFCYNRRLVAVLCGAHGVRGALKNGYAGRGEETLESTPPLGEFYQRMQAGLSLATAEGQWWFGLALLKESVAL